MSIVTQNKRPVNGQWCLELVSSMFCWGCAVRYRVIMIMSSNGNIFRVTGPLWGESIHREFPSQRSVTARSFDVFFGVRPNKQLKIVMLMIWNAMALTVTSLCCMICVMRRPKCKIFNPNHKWHLRHVVCGVVSILKVYSLNTCYQLQIKFMRPFCEIVLRWMPQNTFMINQHWFRWRFGVVSQ